MTTISFVQVHTNINEKSIINTLSLLQEGATVPFIARYRKEMTVGLDEVQIADIRDYSKKFEEICSRQKTILSSIEEQGKLTTELQEKIGNCFDSVVLEDLYLPFKQKRQTKGDKAKKLGLEPLAKMIMSQKGGDPFAMADKFIKGDVIDEEMALSGAKDIIAEWVNENTIARARVRTLFQRKSILTTKLVKGKEAEGAKYRDYFDFSEPLYKCASHRFLALYRAEREGILSLKTQPSKEEALESLERFFVKGNDGCADLVSEACAESYKRLMCPSLETETMNRANIHVPKLVCR